MLKGRNILITGAAGYLGKVFANHLLGFQANLILVDKKYNELKVLKKNIWKKIWN